MAIKTTLPNEQQILDSMERMVKEQRLIHGHYIDDEIDDPSREHDLCGGRRACLVGSMWLAGGIQIEYEYRWYDGETGRWCEVDYQKARELKSQGEDVEIDVDLPYAATHKREGAFQFNHALERVYHAMGNVARRMLDTGDFTRRDSYHLAFPYSAEELFERYRTTDEDLLKLIELTRKELEV